MPHPAPWPPYDAAHLLVEAATMAALEESLFRSGLPVEALMEKAALAVSRRLLQRPPEAALVLVGPGHNGGDGLVVARELHLAGVPVRIWSPFARRKPLPEAHLRHARWLGIPVLEDAPQAGDGALWIDALFGLGQNRPPAAPIEALLAEREAQRPGRLAAIDVPTGLCADSGRLLGRCAARAQRTWCLGLAKRGLLQDGALHWVGELERIDLGLPAPLLATLPPETPRLLVPADRSDAPWPEADPAASKYARGRLLVVAGSSRYRGAAQLALSGASAAGCGSLRAALPAALAEGLWSVQPHVVPEPPLGSCAGGALDLAELAEDCLARLDAVLLGPGLGVPEAIGKGESEWWRQLRGFPGLLVLDADGLNRLAQGPESGLEPAEWLGGRGGPTWITPHPGEFARLFPSWAELPPLEAAAAAARASGATVLLKGARSVVAAPDGRRWQLGQAGAGAARAGLGDVLAGYAAGMGARAVAAAGMASGLESALLAAAALDHATAGLEVCDRPGAAGTTPLAVAEALARRPGP
ncbi:MAG: NAD(P)H-hydrate dehydratase [Synechococcaceae cyanobacterium]|nr:NAD(P)H-hydrate dehydratase [Synechococcaceae cyanobacterium]